MIMVEQLFGSKTRVKLLQLFYGNPNRSFYVREITRKIDEQINSVRRELANLLSIGIISSENTNNKLFYEVNQKYEHYKPLSQIFSNSKAKNDSDENSEEDELKNLGNVELLVLTGRFTRDERSGIDLLLVGDLNQTQVAKYVTKLEKKENKEIRYATMPSSEFNYRRNLNDRFLVTVLESKKQIIADKEGLLEKKNKANKKDKKDTKEEE